jgi:hypothetical protein
MWANAVIAPANSTDECRLDLETRVVTPGPGGLADPLQRQQLPTAHPSLQGASSHCYSRHIHTPSDRPTRPGGGH